MLKAHDMISGSYAHLCHQHLVNESTIVLLLLTVLFYILIRQSYCCAQLVQEVEGRGKGGGEGGTALTKAETGGDFHQKNERLYTTSLGPNVNR